MMALTTEDMRCMMAELKRHSVPVVDGYYITSPISPHWLAALTRAEPKDIALFDQIAARAARAMFEFSTVPPIVLPWEGQPIRWDSGWTKAHAIECWTLYRARRTAGR